MHNTKIEFDSATQPDSQPDTVILSPQGQEYTVSEIENSNRIYKSKTPKQDLSWYVKWCSSLIVLVAITVRASGIQELQVYDVLLSWIGAMGWFWVGMLWKDRALILLNGVIAIVLFGGLMRIANQLGWFNFLYL